MTKETAKTLEDIARIANVSASTVSRALNNSPLLSQETRERVQEIAREQNFQVNSSARNLRLRQSMTIGFVAPVYYPEFLSPEDLFGLEILEGVGKGLHTLGYDLLVIHTDPDEESWAHNYFDRGRVDGFVLISSTIKKAQIDTLIRMGAPFIVWGLPFPGYSYSSVTGDNFNGGWLATQHLVRIGRKKIAFLGGPEDQMTVQNRFKGYEKALQAAGCEVNPNLLANGDYSFASGATAMQRLLRQSPDLDAVFVNSDLMAIGAINVLQETGRHVPEDVAVVGYDDLSIARYNNLPLTTIRQNLPLAGKLLAQNLVQFIQTGTLTNVTTPVELAIRKSA